MALDFPNSPTIGDEFTGGGFTWVWDGTSWTKMAAATVAGSNDFALLVGVSGDTTYVLDRTYTSGRYTIEFANGDTTYDIYFIAADGTYAGYTNTTVAEVTADFSEIVVLGAASSETILFTHQGVLTSPSSIGDVATAGAFINSVVTSSLPNIDDTTVVNGGNFAADVQVSFIAQDATETAAKAVVRSSSTQLVVTRPDSFSPDDSPYTVKVVNPGIPVPAGTNAHLLSNAVTAGTNPSWVTATTVVYNISAPSSITLEATDTEGSDIDYSVVTGTLPAGLSLDEETGVISGTFSGSANEGDVTSVTVRATDAGGNFLDKAFDFTANAAPIWTTAAGALDGGGLGNAYSYQLVASGGTQGGALTYTIQSGALPDGLSLSTSGLISGTPTTLESASFTVRVTDEGQSFTDRAFSIDVVSQVSVEYLVIAGGGGGGWTTTRSGGAGAGGYRSSVSGEASGGGASAESPLLVITDTPVNVTVGAGGIGQWVEQHPKTSGTNSEFAGIVSVGGGFGGTRNGIGAAGGSGGGSPQGAGGAAEPGQGYPGYSGMTDQASGGGGAGAASIGITGGAGVASSITGTSVYRGGGGSGGQNGPTWYVGGIGGGGAGGGSYPRSLKEKEGVPNTGGGGGGGSSYYTNGANGGSGFVAIRYASTHKVVVSPGLTSYDLTIGGNTVTVFEAGTGTVTFEAVTAPTTFSAEYVVVAGGGGGGGHYYAGGGGGGGYQAVSTTLSSGVNYGLTIGGGGTHVLASGANRYGWQGFDSRFGQTLSIGGGGGQPSLGAVQNPYTGGSGGGGGGDGAANGLNSGVGALGIAGQGNAGGRGFSRPGAGAGGGGGGAAAVGGNAGANNGNGGNGGAGASTTITGSTTYYAGGGGGGCRGAYAPGAGGIGGGASGVANEGSPNPQPGPGTVNTGGGGGGAGWDGGIGGFGGSGIVIVKYPDTRTANIPVGITASTDSSSVPGYKVTTFTAGTGTVTFS